MIGFTMKSKKSPFKEFFFRLDSLPVSFIATSSSVRDSKERCFPGDASEDMNLTGNFLDGLFFKLTHFNVFQD